MIKLLLPWESNVLINYPWTLTIFVIVLSVPLSIITWIRQKQKLK